MKIRKRYEIVGMNNCLLKITYLRVLVTVEFREGNIANSVNATLTTDNPFIQAAIEHDRRFKDGRIRVVQTTVVEEETVEPAPKEEAPVPAEVEPEEETEAPAPVAPEKPKTKSKTKASAVTEALSTEAVESVRNLNDAMAFFAAKGEAIESEEQIEELKERYKVTFPNWQ